MITGYFIYLLSDLSCDSIEIIAYILVYNIENQERQKKDNEKSSCNQNYKKSQLK